MTEIISIGDDIKLFPVPKKDIYPEMVNDLVRAGAGPRVFEGGDELPTNVMDKLICQTGDYIRRQRSSNPNFDLYVSCYCEGSGESTIGKIVGGHDGYLFIAPTEIIEDEDDDPEHFARYDIDYINDEHRFYPDDKLPPYIYEIGDYYHIFKCFYVAMVDNSSVKSFLQTL